MCFAFSALNEKSMYAIINVIVKITDILLPEPITNVLNQQMQETQVLAYDDTIWSILMYIESRPTLLKKTTCIPWHFCKSIIIVRKDC